MGFNTKCISRGKDMELKTTAIAGAALLAIMMISGCAGTPELDENWGRSYEEAKATQTMNPDGHYNLAPVEGQQGPVVERILNDYLKSEPEAK
jgi:hypothetical protein